MHLMPVSLDGKASIGAAGAVTSFGAIGVASIARISTGRYRITLQDPYASLSCLNAMMKSPSAGSPSGVHAIELISEQVATSSQPSLDLQCFDSAGALVDPASGSDLKFQLLLNNSSVQ